MQRTCFVISPIGQAGTDIRKDADEFLELLIEPALERFDFNVVRADRIPRPTVITADIIRLVQEADVCIIDITHSNPNVFYECGRRHETGKPFVQMIRTGKTNAIPFDVAGIRTIEYDLATTRKARESVKTLQDFIEEIVSTDFREKAAGHTMGSIGEALERLERKINRLGTVSTPIQGSAIKGSGEGTIELLTSHPVKAFYKSLERGDLQTAFSTLERVKTAAGISEYIAGLGVLSKAGIKDAYDILIEQREELMDAPDENEEKLDTIAHVMKDYYVNQGRADVGIQELEKFYKRLIEHPNCTDRLKATVANCVGMTAWMLDAFDLGAKYEAIAVDLAPDVAPYRYNQCLTFQELGESEKLHNALTILSTLPGLDANHLDLLHKHGYQYAPAEDDPKSGRSAKKTTKKGTSRKAPRKRKRKKDV